MLNIKQVIGDYNLFFDTIFGLLVEAGFSNEEIKEYQVDHVCYRVSTPELYEEKKGQLKELGELLVETEVGGRPISTYKLKESIHYEKYNKLIPLIELPFPKKNRINTDGLEHIEMVINQPFQTFVDNHPSEGKNFTWVLHALKKEINADIEVEFIDPNSTSTPKTTISVKFHHQPLEDVIKYEIELSNLNK